MNACDVLIDAYRQTGVTDPGNITKKVLMETVRVKMRPQKEKLYHLVDVFGINHGNYDRWFQELNKSIKDHGAPFVDIPDEYIIKQMTKLGWEVVNG